MNTTPFITSTARLLSFGVIVVALTMGAIAAPSENAKHNDAYSRPKQQTVFIFPPGSRPYGKTYGEWSASWWLWASSIPAAENPLFDTTGEFASNGQSGPVWFLAGVFGGTVEREITVPANKALFFPLLNALWWAPEDVETAKSVVEEQLGLDPDDYTDLELISLLSNYHIGPDPKLTLTIDGVAIRPKYLEQLKTDSPPFQIKDTDLIDDVGGPISNESLAVSAGYWVMLEPLSPGEHTIHFTSSYKNELDGRFTLDVTYHLTVAKKGH